MTERCSKCSGAIVDDCCACTDHYIDRLELLPDRELDKFVSESIFNISYDKAGTDGYYRLTSNPHRYDFCPRYSTNMSDAWLVIKEMVVNKGLRVETCWNPGEYLEVSIDEIDNHPPAGFSQYKCISCEENKSEPLAIIITALKAMQVISNRVK